MYNVRYRTRRWLARGDGYNIRKHFTKALLIQFFFFLNRSSQLYSVTAYASLRISSALSVRIFATPRWQRPPSGTWTRRALVIEGGRSHHHSLPAPATLPLSRGLTAATTPSHCITFTSSSPGQHLHSPSSIIYSPVSSAPATNTLPASQTIPI